MSSKAYPKYMCFFRDIFSNQHILLNKYTKQHIMSNNILYYTTYMACTTYIFNNIHMCINDVYILLNLIRHIYTVSLNNIYVILR